MSVSAKTLKVSNGWILPQVNISSGQQTSATSTTAGKQITTTQNQASTVISVPLS